MSLSIISWNLYYRSGAVASDLAELIRTHDPDMVLMQEVTEPVKQLTKLVGGKFYAQAWEGKSYGMAVWISQRDAHIRPHGLPFSRLPGTFPRRFAQMIDVDGLTIANVHLSHGQILNRRQLRSISRIHAEPMAIIGDFNLVGPVLLGNGFRDVGPRGTTHRAQGVVPLRLDRCLVRDLTCLDSTVLDWGASDHAPIMLSLAHDPGRGQAHSREQGWKFLRR